MAQYRRTTPQHIFNTDIDLTSCEVIYLTYEQGPECKPKKILEKVKEEMEVEADKVTVGLTQEETLKFSPDDKVAMQFRVKYPNGDALASNKMYATFEDILKGGVI